MRAAGVHRIAFSSTGSVYGEPEVFPTPETCPFPVQTSLYGASKLAGEGLIQAYAHGYGFVGVIFRFVSILGERYTHGHVFDFCRSLRKDPSRLRVLGDGRQEKSYLYVGDCVSAMKLATEQPLEAGAVSDLQPRDRRDHRGRRLDRDDHGAPRRLTRARVHGRHPRMARRQPTDPPRLRADSLARLATDVAHSGRDQTDGRLARAEPDLPRRANTPHERHLQSSAAARQPRRRRNRSPLLLPSARRLPGQRGDRQVRLHAHPHGLPAPVQDEVLAVRGSRRSLRDPPSDPARVVAAPLERRSARSERDRRRAGGNRPRLLRLVHACAS